MIKITVDSDDVVGHWVWSSYVCHCGVKYQVCAHSGNWKCNGPDGKSCGQKYGIDENKRRSEQWKENSRQS